MACGGCGNNNKDKFSPKREKTVFRRERGKISGNVSMTEGGRETLDDPKAYKIFESRERDEKLPLFDKNNSVLSNLVEAATKQANPIRWFKDGVSGIIKCLKQEVSYTDEDIQKNRDACRNCEHATKTDGKLTMKSQCMAPDPNNNHAPCGCIILCKTQSGECPLDKWKTTKLTIDGK